MPRIICLFLTGFLLAGCRPPPPAEIRPAEIETTLFLIGDAGAPNPREVGVPLDSLAAHAALAPQRSIIVFLGDNVYPQGVPAEGSAEWADSRRRLAAQVGAIPKSGRGIFIPGNQDWAGENAFGLYSIRLQEKILASLAEGRDVRMLPGNGCPGPVMLNIGRLRLIALDTQWWLHYYIVRDSNSNCPAEVAAVTSALRAQVQSARAGQVVVVVGHHPLMTGGAHGGYCGISGPFRRFGGRAQDIISKSNRTMRDSLESAFSTRPPMIYAAGHDHNLQVLRGGSNVEYLLVSGAGSDSKVACAVRLRESYYMMQHHGGFIRLDIVRERGVLLRVYRYDSRGHGGLAHTQWLEAR